MNKDIISATLILLVLVVISFMLGKYQESTRLKYETETLMFVDYPAVITSIDEQNRLHIINLTENCTTIYSDSVTQNIHSQVALRIYNKYAKSIK